MHRRVEPEQMDCAPPDDPETLQARRGLRRVNFWMGNGRIIARTLARLGDRGDVRRLADLGAGDGAITLEISESLKAHWPKVDVALVDRHNLLADGTRERFRQIGWEARAETVDVFAWLAKSPTDVDVVIANLFLHHFEEVALSELLRLVAQRTRIFVACDPLRSIASLRACPFLWLIGCNRMVRHDAAISVRAGFQGRELSVLWPTDPKWQLEERQAGLCSHLFCACRD